MSTVAPSPEAVWEALRAIPDPEFGVNLVDLGLIYSVDCDGAAVKVVMTLTTPGCPSGSWMFEGVRSAVAALPGVADAQVEMTFEPLWNTSMISEAGRRQLGMEGE